MSYTHAGVKREALAAILQPIVEREGHYTVAAQIEAAGYMKRDAAARCLNRIFMGEYTTRDGNRVVQQLVNLNHADQIIQALDLTHVWQIELRDAVVYPSKTAKFIEPPPPKPRRTHCQRGHELTPENSKIDVAGAGNFFVRCRTCRREQDCRRKRAALKQAGDVRSQPAVARDTAHRRGGTNSLKEAA